MRLAKYFLGAIACLLIVGVAGASAQGPMDSSNLVPKTNWKLAFVDSQETQCENGAAVNSFDASAATIWHTQYCTSVAQLPHEIQIDMGTAYIINGFRYLPRQDGGSNGRIGQYEFYATNDLSNWGTPLATGSFANDAIEKQVLFASNVYRYIRLRALTEASGGPWTSAADLNVLQSSDSSSSSAGVPPTPAEDELESEDCNTFRSAAEVHGPPLASVSARSRMYRYTLDAKRTCFSIASLAKLPVASGVP